MIDLFATTVEKPEVRLIPSLICGGVAGLSIAIIEIIVWSTGAHWLNRVAIAFCPGGVLFWFAEVEGSTGFRWLILVVAVCITNIFVWAGIVGVISAAIQKLLHLSHRPLLKGATHENR